MSNMLINTLKKSNLGSKVLAFLAVDLHIYSSLLTEVDMCIDQFDSASKNNNKKRREITQNCYYYGIMPSEYYLFHFYEKDKKGKSSFLGRQESKVIWDKCRDTNRGKVFRDKYLCYQTFFDLYKRSIIKINSSEDIDQFFKLAKIFNKCIVKPIDSNQAKGVFALSLSNKTSECLEKIFYDLILPACPCVIEEYVEQSNELSVFHPSSVNTVRFVTLIDRQGEVHSLYAILRTGVGKSVTDNLASGGIAAAIDLKNGCVIGNGFKEDGSVFNCHPESGIVYPGYQLPDWQELLHVVNQAAKVIPEQKLVGWDFAHCNNKGWVMIEGNRSPSFTGIQMCTQNGIKKEVISMIY